MRCKAFIVEAVLVPLLTMACGAAQAGLIIGVRSVGGAGLGGVVKFDTGAPDPNNDDPDGGPTDNFVNIDKFFEKTDTIDINMEVRNSDPDDRTRYLFTDTVTNLTKDIWTDFHFELGFGGADTVPAFVQSNLKDLLDFDFEITKGAEDPTKPKPPAPGASRFVTPDRKPNTLDWKDGRVRPGQSVLFTFTLDIPDRSDEIPKSARLDNGYRFTLRQRPTKLIPEPSGFVLLGLGSVALIVFVRRANRRDKAWTGGMPTSSQACPDDVPPVVDG